jgi:hypothetical protein
MFILSKNCFRRRFLEVALKLGFSFGKGHEGQKELFNQ